MRIDVVFSPAGVSAADVQGKSVEVIDVLRASTTIAVALANGAKAVLPAASTEEALRIAQNLEKGDTVLAGERKAQRVPGFALGNSPAEFTAEVVHGKTVVLATTNGTVALVAVQGAKQAIVASAVNFGVVVEKCREVLLEEDGLMIVCAGSERQFALEDAFAAGRIAKALMPEGGLRKVAVNDGALAALEIARHYGERWLRAFRASTHGQELAELGYREDVRLAAQEDSHPILPLYTDRRITGHRPAH